MVIFYKGVFYFELIYTTKHINIEITRNETTKGTAEHLSMEYMVPITALLAKLLQQQRDVSFESEHQHVRQYSFV